MEISIFSGGNHPLPTGLLRLTLTLGKVVSHILLNQNDREGCRIDHLDDLGHFLLGFGATRKISQGVGSHPLGTRLIKYW